MFRRHFLMEEAGASGSGGASQGGAGAGTPNIGDPGAAGGGAAGAGGANTGAGSGAGAAASGGGVSSAWLDSLPDDIKGDPSIQLFKESGINGLAKSWVNAQKMIGADKVIIPTEKSTNEEWAAFHAKLGRPESADKYDIKLPEGQKLDEGFAKGFKETAFAQGMSAKQVQSMAEWYAKATSEYVQTSQQAAANELSNSLKAYAESVGGQEKYMARVETARQAVRALGDESLNKFLKETGAGSRPEMIEFFAKLAGMMSEDKLRDGTGVPFGEDPVEIQRQITNIEGNLFTNMNSPHKDEWVGQLQKLYERLEAARQPRQ